MHRQIMVALMAVYCLTLAVAGCAKKEVVRSDPAVQAAAPSLPAPREVAATTGAEAATARTAAVEAAAALGTDEGINVDGAPQDAAKIPSELKHIHFEFDSYLLTPQARDIMANNAEVLTEGPQVKVRVAGHCDERGSDDYNLALSDRRARAAVEYLVSLGVSPKRLSAIGYGKERPAAAGHDENSWAQNRRDEFEMMP